MMQVNEMTHSEKVEMYQMIEKDRLIEMLIEANDVINRLTEVKNLRIADVITPLLTDKEIEEYIWENISVSLSQYDIDNHTDGYIQYLNAVYWAKWGRDNCNGL